MRSAGGQRVKLHIEAVSAGIDHHQVGGFSLAHYQAATRLQRLFQRARLILVDLAAQRAHGDGQAAAAHGTGHDGVLEPVGETRHQGAQIGDGGVIVYGR